MVVKWQSSGSQVEVKWQSSGSQVAVKWHSSGRQVEVNWQSSGLQVVFKWKPSGNQLIVKWQTTESMRPSQFPSGFDWLNWSTVAAFRISQRIKYAWNGGLWLVESLESRLLIGREPPPEIFKGVTLTIQNLCQCSNFGSILSNLGCNFINIFNIIKWY